MKSLSFHLLHVALAACLLGRLASAQASVEHGHPIPGLRPLVLEQPKRLWGYYLHHLDRSPILTKTCTSVIASLLGDALAQQWGRPKDIKDWKYDWARTWRMTLFQGLLLGPLGHVYYTSLDAKVHPESAKAPTTVVTKMLIDQLIFAPLATLVFYAYKCAAERRFRQLRRELREKYLPTLFANWKLWPAAHIINFAFVPTEQRILFANVVSVLGVYILSRAAAGDFSGAAGTKRRPWQHHLQRRSSQQAQLLVPLIPVGAAAAAPHQQLSQRQLSQRAPAPTLRATSQQLQQQEEGGGGPSGAGRAAAVGLGLSPVAPASGQHLNPARSPFAQAALGGNDAPQREVEVKLE